MRSIVSVADFWRVVLARSWVAALLGAVSLLAADAPEAELSAGADPGSLILRNLTIIDGNGGWPLPNRTLVIREGRIARILDSTTEPAEPRSRSIDLRGHFAIPGLVDSHVHLTLHSSDPTAALRAAFYGGVTAVRDMGGDEAVLAWLAKRSGDPRRAEPRVHFAIAIRGTPPQDHDTEKRTLRIKRPALPLWLHNIASDESMLQGFVAKAVTLGGSGIKLYSDLSPERMAQASALAKHASLQVWGHARVFPNRPSDGVRAHIDVLSHSSQLAFEHPEAADDGDAHRVVSPVSPAISTLLASMRARGVVLEPTLSASSNAAGGGGGTGSRLSNVPSFSWSTRVTRLAHEIGVALLAGTDQMTERNGNVPGIHTEMQLLVEQAGLTPLEAITTATRTAARVLGVELDYGTIGIGKRADLAILRADPSASIRNTRKVALVVKSGVVHMQGSTSAQHGEGPRD